MLSLPIWTASVSFLMASLHLLCLIAQSAYCHQKGLFRTQVWIVKSWNPPECFSTEKWINWYMYKMEHYWATKKNQLLIHPTTWWISRALCWVKKANLKRLHAVYDSVSVTFTKWENVREHLLARAYGWWKSVRAEQPGGGFWQGDGTDVCPDGDGGYPSRCIWWN